MASTAIAKKSRMSKASVSKKKKTAKKKKVGRKVGTTAVVNKAAKKTAKKTAKRAGVKSTGAKRAKKHAAKAKTARSGGSLAPKPVTTGRGAGPAEIGRDVVAMVRAGAPDAKIWDKWFHKDFVSIEGVGQAWRGRRAVEEKCRRFFEENTIMSVDVGDPMVGGTGFAVRYTMTLRNNATGQDQEMTEVGVYTVKNGKVVQEEFMYAQ